MFKKINKNLKYIGIMLAACLASVIFAIPTLAAEGTVSETYVEVAEGSTYPIYIGAIDAASPYTVSSSGSVSARINGNGFVDDSTTEQVDIFGAGIGSGTVTVTFTDLVTNDEVELGSMSYTISVNVYEPEGGYTPDKGGDDGGEQQQPAEEETTTADPNADKLKVTVDGAEYTVLKDLASIELPKGFTEADGTYNGEKVKVLTFGKELTLYVLKKNDDGSIIFRTYNEKDKKFEAPKTLVQNKITYYLLDIPADEKDMSYGTRL